MGEGCGFFHGIAGDEMQRERFDLRARQASEHAVQPARAIEPPIAKVLRLQNRRPKFSLARAAAIGREVAARVIPPIVVIALIALVWEVLCRKQGATLPPP